MADEDIWDSWEDFADSGDIDKCVEQGLNLSNGSHSKSKEKVKKAKQTTEVNTRNSSHKEKNNQSPQSGIRILQRPPVVHEEDQNRTPFMPQLKILRRPEKSSEEQRNAEEQKRLQLAQQPVRTLAQREAAYAEARQRIMGVNQSTDTNCKHNATDSRPENLRRYSKQVKAHQNGYANDVKRQPKGPSNGKGFKHNR